MSDRPSPKLYAQFVLAIAGLLVLPAIWSLLSAVWSASTTGDVLVISIGRYEVSRSLVPWPQGWSRFAGPIALVTSLFLWSRSKAGDRTRLWWFSVALAMVALALLLFSQWFTSWRGVLWFGGILVFITAVMFIGNKLGRLTAVAFVAIVFGFIVWKVARDLTNPSSGPPPAAAELNR